MEYSSPNGKRQFSGVVRATQIRWSRCSAAAPAFAAKGIIQSPITSCSRRDHSVCQASTNRNPEKSKCRQGGLSAGKGWWECTAQAKSDIYDCVVSFVLISEHCSLLLVANCQLDCQKQIQELIRRWDSERELLRSAPGSYPNSLK